MKSVFKHLEKMNSHYNDFLTSVTNKKALRIAGTVLVSSSLITSQIIFAPIQQAHANQNQVCPTPGKDGVGIITGIINTYYPGASETVVPIGASSIPVGAMNPNGNQTPIQQGDLLIVIQMQDTDINSTDTDAYGDGIGGDVPDTAIAPSPLGASGYTNLNNTGRYEYFVADGPVTNGAIRIKGTTKYSYRNQTGTTAHGQRTYQVVRVPQFSNATVVGTLTTAAQWNGASGGIVAVDVAGQLNFSAGSIVDVNGLGFRGGGSNPSPYSGGSTSPSPFRTITSGRRQGDNAPKGEGIAGTPRIVSTQPFGQFNVRSATVTTDLNTPNYPNGDEGRGAPGNAGGGGNEHNSGGGGGANGGSGGMGGRSFNNFGGSPPQFDAFVGGFGGKALPPDPLRLMLGGGGGAGDTNDQTEPSGAGGGGGGIVIIRAGSVTGNGTINAKGANGINSPEGARPDAGGGGGAGGTVLVATASGNTAGLVINVTGGAGGNLHQNNTSELDGPGGGGGGGAVYTTGGALIDTSGGQPGLSTNNTGPRNNTPNGATSGSTGINQPVSLSELTTSISGSDSSCSNNPNVLLVKRITGINNQTQNPGGDNLAAYKDESTNPYDDNIITITNPNPPTQPADTNKWPDPNTFLIGGTRGGKVNPGDEIEYTIYFLSAGDSTANKVFICDRIPENVSFIPAAFNGSGSPVQVTGGIPGADRGIVWRYNDNLQSLTNVRDGDAAQYFPPGTDPKSIYPNVNCGGANTNGAVVVNLGNLPNATAPATPAGSYGFVRFRGRVK